jgi:hypothetical protein
MMPMTDTELKGKVAIIDQEKRTITLKDPEGILHPFTWTEPLDVVMRKWKEGYYLTITHDGEILKNAKYWQEGKDSFPKNQGSGRPFTPRNEKPTAYESAFKSCVELVRPEDFKGLDYAARVAAVRTEAEKIGDWILQKGGIS